MDKKYCISKGFRGIFYFIFELNIIINRSSLERTLLFLIFS